MKVDIGQLKGKGLRVTRVLRPSDRDGTPRRGIRGGHLQVGQCRSKGEEKENAGQKKMRKRAVCAKKDDEYLRATAGCIRLC